MTKKKTQALVTKPDQSVEGFIQQAIEKSLPVETMEKLFSLREKVKAERAKEAFVVALSDFQRVCPIIKKSKKVMNKDGRTLRYQYAPLDSIVDQIRKPLADCGISYTWNVKNDEGFITAIATVKHQLGHSETSEFKVPIDPEGYMTAPQKYASALTFAKRYSLCNALGISTGDEDTDAVDVNKESEAKSPKSKIVFLLRTLGYETKDKTVVETAIKDLAKLDLDPKNYDEIISRLEILVKEQQEYEKSNIQE